MLHIDNRSGDLLDEPALHRLCELVLRLEKATADSEVNLVLCTSDLMRDYNRRFRGPDRATDVLSFPSDIGVGGELGDILIDTQTAARQKGDNGLDDEVQMLLLHGLLHLLGHNHQGQRQRMAMQDRQQRYMRQFQRGET
ncbi:MAG: rRNA maturation RNase YbeY [Candidatus Cloacimonetes bacterium]|nr:rRNA maturation RNase YbeY [Candidatus Cloacimonadota bacterium]